MGIIVGHPWFVSCDLTYSGEGTPSSYSGERKFLQEFLIVTKEKLLDPKAVCLCPGLPLIGAPYIAPGGLSLDSGALLIDQQARRQAKDDWQNWIVTCNYSTTIPKKSQDPDHPEQDRPDVSWDYETIQFTPLAVQEMEIHKPDGTVTRKIATAATGFFPIWNSAMQSFSKPPEGGIAFPILKISRNELSHDPDRAIYFAYALNLYKFLGKPPNVWQCRPPRAVAKYKGPIGFWRVSYEIALAPLIPNPIYVPADEANDREAIGDPIIYRPWDPYVQDQGMFEIQDDPDRPNFGKLVAIKDAHNRPVTHDVPLDGNGKAAEMDGFTGRIFPTYILFKFYFPVDFRDLLVNGLQQGFPP
jgi:hypothetical protein